MEDNRLKREEEEARLRALEERIRGNQQKRLKVLEAELQRRDAKLDAAAFTEMEKLRQAEEARVRRSNEFRMNMQKEQQEWTAMTGTAKKELEVRIRQEEFEKR